MLKWTITFFRTCHSFPQHGLEFLNFVDYGVLFQNEMEGYVISAGEWRQLSLNRSLTLIIHKCRDIFKKSPTFSWMPIISVSEFSVVTSVQ